MNALNKKPGIAQLKTGITAQTTRRPVAPPIYRPQPAPKTVQPKMANVVVNRKPPVAPPVYNPYQRHTAVQAKVQAKVQATSGVGPPPVYRPQPLPKVLQTKTIAGSNKPNASVQKRLVGPPATKPPRVIPSGQRTVMQAKPAAPIMSKPASRPANTSGARALPPRSSNTIQRQITFTHGQRLRQNNVANTLSSLVDFGITRTTLNGTAFPNGPGSEDLFIASLLEPAILMQRVSGGVAVSVQAVGLQRLSYIMELPTGGPWQLQVDKQNIAVKLGSQPTRGGVHIPIGDSETGSVTLDVKGLPSDAEFASMVETHEDVHVADIQTAINTVLKPWDDRLTRMSREEILFKGVDETAATAKLYEAAGGTPREVAMRFVAMLKQMGRAFHETEAGQAPVIVDMARRGMFNGTLEVTLQHRGALGALHERRLEREREAREYQEALQESMERPVRGPINRGGAGNSFITDGML